MRKTSLLFLTGLAIIAAGGCGSSDPDGADTAREGHASYVETIRGSSVTFEMVWVPEGNFWIGKHEVTWDEYLLYCDFDESGAVPPDADAVAKPSKPLDDVAPFDRDWGKGRRPAVGMSKNAAQKYCEWLSKNTGKTYRLPTEDEWALAAGPVPAALDDYAWHFENAGGMTQEVGRKKANDHGLHDMYGNLWEVVAEPFTRDEPERAAYRGGSWKTKPEEITLEARLGFEEAWTMLDPNVPPGVWWVPDGDHLGMRVIRVP